MNCYLIDCHIVDWLMQLSLAVGTVHIARPVVDYKSYLCQEADSLLEGMCICVFFSISGIYVCVIVREWVDLYLSCPTLTGCGMN